MLILLFWAYSFSCPNLVGASDTLFEEGDCSIFFGKLLAGNSHYSIHKSENGDILISTDTVTHAAIKNKGKIEFSQKLDAVIDGNTGEIKSYHIVSSSPFKAEDTQMHFGATGVKVARKTDGTVVESTLTYSKIPGLLDIRNPGGGNWNLPLLQYELIKEELHKKDRLELEGLYTGSFQNIHLSFEKVEEKPAANPPYILYDMKEGREEIRIPQKLYLSPETGKIIKFESPCENFTYTMEKGRKVYTPSELFQAFSIPQEYDVKNCSTVKARVKMKVLAENVDINLLSAGAERFEGSFNDGILEGAVDVRSSHFKTLDSAGYPCSFNEEGLKECLKPEFLVESEDRDIQVTAQTIVKDSKTVKDAVNRLGWWVYENIKFEYTDGSAKATLLSRKGDWLPRIRLFMALCRSLGIPARYAGGFFLNENTAGKYIWAEIYMGKSSGWIPVDVAMGQIDYFSANHITLWHYGFFDPYTFSPELKVTEYTEEPRPKGTKMITR